MVNLQRKDKLNPMEELRTKDEGCSVRSESDEDNDVKHASSDESNSGDVDDVSSSEKHRKGRRPRECSTTLQAKWDEMFARLVRFRQNHGHCLVPNRYAEDPQLGSWVSTQRRQYKILTSGGSESTPMTPERASKLMSIGFEWATKDPRHVPWETRYSELIQFVEKYGHAQVPIGWEENVQLSNWVSTQRQEYKLLRKGRSSRLTNERMKLLNNVGFVWEAQRGGPRRRRRSNNSMNSSESPSVRASAEDSSLSADAAAGAVAVGVGQNQLPSAATMIQAANLRSYGLMEALPHQPGAQARTLEQFATAQHQGQLLRNPALAATSLAGGLGFRAAAATMAPRFRQAFPANLFEHAQASNGLRLVGPDGLPVSVQQWPMGQLPATYSFAGVGGLSQLAQPVIGMPTHFPYAAAQSMAMRGMNIGGELRVGWPQPVASSAVRREAPTNEPQGTKRKEPMRKSAKSKSKQRSKPEKVSEELTGSRSVEIPRRGSNASERNRPTPLTSTSDVHDSDSEQEDEPPPQPDNSLYGLLGSESRRLGKIPRTSDRRLTSPLIGPTQLPRDWAPSKRK